MLRSPASRRRGLAARLTTLIVSLAALPLMAPTCGDPGEGFKTFSRNSIIIPMDVCYQYQTDQVQGSYTPASCPQAVDPGNVIRAYGLVYQLIRSGIAVYWVIDNSKATVTGIDLTVQYAGGIPALMYDWASGAPGGAATASHAIDYRGGPFVVDGSDFARASAVLQTFRSTFQNVNVHVSNVSFRGYAKRTMAGGWSAGGTVPPKLALLDIGSTGAGSKNSEFVIQGYLTQAGLDTAGAAGTATGTHGQIYDRLFMSDFVPSVPGDWTTTNLSRNGYQVLWVPHWAAPSSCSDCPPGASCDTTRCNNTRYDAATISSALRTIGSFVAAGGDLFAECAGMGSFEGVFANAPPNTSGYSSIYEDGEPTTTFQTVPTTGLWIETNTPAGAHLWPGNFNSPFMQLGDYPFFPRSGAISDYKPSRYDAGTDPAGADSTIRLISETPDAAAWDIFTLRPRFGSRGSIVYLGGHSYSGNDGSFEIAGTRLVLNTLFNLGASCTATGVACNTGLPGVCSAGTFVCQGGQPVCVATVQPGTRAEVCNGLDDDCDWAVDEGLQTECYEPPPGYVDPDGRSITSQAFLDSRNVGMCRPGISTCQLNNGVYAMSACAGQVLPAAETCNALDDDCDSQVDEGLAQACYDGPPGTLNVGVCRAGQQVCQGGAWGSCGGEVLPTPEACGEGDGGVARDEDCNGQLNNGCTCTQGQTQVCFSGPGLAGQGICATGTQTCLAGGAWGSCVGEVVAVPGPEACVTQACKDTPACASAADTDCDGDVVVCPECATGTVGPCYDGNPADVRGGQSQCRDGARTCVAGRWGPCTSWVGPSAIEYCDSVDNNCDGSTDGAICPGGFACEHGVCVPDACGTELPPPEGYTCIPPSGSQDPEDNGTVVRSTCGVQSCADGELCQYGTCIDPCPPNGTGTAVCATGTVCGGGACIAGGCYEAGCPTDEVCIAGGCVADPCAGVQCPGGTFCRQGDCVQACTFVSCFNDEKCGIDGFCEPDPCAGRTCNPGQRCTAGTCAADPCLGKGCAAGQVCQAVGGQAICADDPCAGVTCPVGVCAGGQCFPTGNPTGIGTISRDAAPDEASGCGCGSGGAAAWPALLALLAAPLARRRRPRAGRSGGIALVLATVALAAGACKESTDPFDPSACTLTCGEARCVDVFSDPGHCGACIAACGSGERCVDGHCGPGSAVAPFIRSLTPSSGSKDDPSVDVDVAGERFDAGATVRLTTPLGPRTLPCPAAGGGDCQWIDAGRIRLRVDLSGAPEVPWTFRIVNPDLVISNAMSFGIGVPVPAIAAVAPTTVVAGTTATLRVQPTGSPGTGFTSGSRCRMQDVPGGEVALPSTLAGEDLDCVFDTSGLLPGVYRLSVMSENDVRSNLVSVTISPSDPVVFAIAPDHGTGVVSISVTGARFDSSSRVLFDASLVPTTTFVDASHLFVSSFALPASGLHQVSVRNGAAAPFKVSNGVPFMVGGATLQITSFTPSTAYQGETVVLEFVGTGFPADSRIELQAPGGSTFDPLVSTPAGCGTTCTRVSASKSLVGQPDGSWLARIRYGATAGDPTSAPWPLRVLSNQAILRGYAAVPDPEDAGTVGGVKSSITFDVANIRGPLDQVRVAFKNPQGADVTVLDPTGPTTTSVTTLVAGPLSLAGLTSGTYTFAVRNPNASDSNALPFAVAPGPPTLTSVCVTGTSCTTSAQQSDVPLSLTLTGANFASPDANGNGSTVMVAADFMPGWPAPDPCIASTSIPSTQFAPAPVTAVTVSSSTQIQVQLDTRAAYAAPGGTTYRVSVWNPGGTSGPQKSDCGRQMTSLPGFTILP